MALMIHNVVLVYDVFVVAESPEAARQAVKDMVTDQDPDQRLGPDDENARPVTHERSIREKWKTLGPIVAADVSDADFDKCKGKTTMQIFEALQTAKATPKK